MFIGHAFILNIIKAVMIFGHRIAALCLRLHHSHDDIQYNSTPAHMILLKHTQKSSGKF